MTHTEYTFPSEIEFSGFSFHPSGNLSGSLLDKEVEEVSPLSREISSADLQQLAWHLTCTSLDQDVNSDTYDHHDLASLDTYGDYSEPLIEEETSLPVSTSLSHSDSNHARHNSIRHQRKSLSRLQTQKSHLRTVDALAHRIGTSSDSHLSPRHSLRERPSSAALNALLEGLESIEPENEQSLDILNLPANVLGFRRSTDLRPDTNWIEKPIRVRKHQKRRK